MVQSLAASSVGSRTAVGQAAAGAQTPEGAGSYASINQPLESAATTQSKAAPGGEDLTLEPVLGNRISADSPSRILIGS